MKKAGKIIPPNVKIVNAIEGIIQITTTNKTTLGRYHVVITDFEGNIVLPNVATIQVESKRSSEPYPDKEDGGVLFCGKCGGELPKKHTK